MKRTRVGLVCKYVYLKRFKKNFQKEWIEEQKGETIKGEMKVNHTYEWQFRVRIKTEFLKKPGPYGLVANPDFKQIQIRI